MLIFGNDKKARGCWREIMGPYTIGVGANLSLPNGTTLPAQTTSGGTGASSGARTDPFFISAIGMTQKEKYHVVQCFMDKNYTYAFGHDPRSSLIDVTFTMFLTGADGIGFGDSLKNMLKAYYESRLSASPDYASLTLGNAFMQGFVVGMSSSTQDPEHNLQSFTIQLLLIEAQGTGAPQNG
jgi:hypothetical protein